ncbi:MAG: hypothetical protein AB7X49_14450, partial [Geminicoccaceae bacterium]
MLSGATALLPERFSPITPARAALGAGPGPRSGFFWSTGASINNYKGFTTYRGRSLDTITCWCPHNTWTEVVSLKGGFVTARKSGSRVSCAIDRKST